MRIPLVHLSSTTPRPLALARRALKLSSRNTTTRYKKRAPFLRKCDLQYIQQTLTLQEAISLALKVLKAVMEEKLSSSNIQVATVTPEKGYQIVSEADLAPVVAALH